MYACFICVYHIVNLTPLTPTVRCVLTDDCSVLQSVLVEADNSNHTHYGTHTHTQTRGSQSLTHGSAGLNLWYVITGLTVSSALCECVKECT